MAGSGKGGIRIMKCTCKHEFQDQTYGPQMRVHNVSPDGLAFCTVCAPNYRLTRMDANTKENRSRHGKKVA